MAFDFRYGPCAQTPAQRAYVLAQLRATFPRYQPTPEARLLHARYVAGELSWAEVHQALTQTSSRPRLGHLRRGA